VSCLLKFDNVEAGYGQARILHGINLEVSEGGAVAVLGRNGVGKTTLVNTLLGLARLTHGEITVRNRPFTGARPYLAARSGIAVVIQGRGILSNLTVHENLILGAATKRSGPWTTETVLKLFPMLKERSNVCGTTLSGGQQQMLAIGRALMANPDLLILDEPSEGLAPVIVDELADVLRGLAENGTSILLIEQNLGLVERVAEEYYVLSKGRVVDRGTMGETTREALNKHIAI
jgi:ABC-type branched-subunit amino acid transport system ATPase component